MDEENYAELIAEQEAYFGVYLPLEGGIKRIRINKKINFPPSKGEISTEKLLISRVTRVRMRKLYSVIFWNPRCEIV